ncbi:MAG: hypothetical protein QOC75_4928 [Pseudonocardiales bacterium]|jgi:hypothetical protein|nr:hypothetical protein [Pseudonocardiales bacterium]
MPVQHRTIDRHPIRNRLAAGVAVTALAMTGAAFGAPMASASPIAPIQTVALASVATPLLTDRGHHGRRDRDSRNHERHGSRCHSERADWDNWHKRWNWHQRCDRW